MPPSQWVSSGSLATAQRDATDSVRMFRRLGDRWGQLQSVYALAALAEISGDYAEAARLHREGLGLAEELGLGADAADRLTGLGRIALLTGDLDESRALHERARRQSAELGYRSGEVHAELGLALVARRAGDLNLAEAGLRPVLLWHQQAKFDPGPALVLAELGFIAELRGDVTAALALQQKALDAAETTGDPRAIALSLEGLAGAHSLAGNHVEARRLLTEATAKRSTATGGTRRRDSNPQPPGRTRLTPGGYAGTRRALGVTRRVPPLVMVRGAGRIRLRPFRPDLRARAGNRPR